MDVEPPPEPIAASIPYTAEQIALARRYALAAPGPAGVRELDPRVGALVEGLIGRVADKWTLLIIEVLMLDRTLRFSRIAEQVPGISQKMLTQTLRHMEKDGLVERRVYAVVPPKVEYTLTTLGLTLSGAFCGVWVWARENLQAVEAARARFDDGLAAAATQEAGRTIVKSGRKQL